MSREYVLDASVLAKWFFEEEGTAIARALADDANRLVAPDFIFIELASIAAKKVRRGDELATYAAEALNRATQMLVRLVPAASLWSGAFDLAVRHGVSVYDGLYLELGIRTGRPVLTADLRLANRMEHAGLAAHVERLGSV